MKFTITDEYGELLADDVNKINEIISMIQKRFAIDKSIRVCFNREVAMKKLECWEN